MSHDLPGVGANLSDHFAMRVTHRVKDEVSINQMARGLKLVGELGRYAATGRGALTFGVTTAMVFCRSREGLASPDLQLLFTPGSYDPERDRPARARARHDARRVHRPAGEPRHDHGQVGRPARPPGDPPELPVGPERPAGAARRHRLCPADLRRPAARPAQRRPRRMPGAGVQSEEALIDCFRNAGSNLHHPVGTCRMGDDPMAVVDARLRVHGLDGLRVVDASIMPAVTTGNTNAPTIMIGEKGAAMIREDARAA